MRVDGATVGEIGRGFLVLFGAEKGTTPRLADEAARKVAGLRVFEDAAGKMNLALADVGGAVLAVSQFTLAADLSRGRRPGSSGRSAAPRPSPSTNGSSRPSRGPASGSRPVSSGRSCRSRSSTTGRRPSSSSFRRSRRPSAASTTANETAPETEQEDADAAERHELPAEAERLVVVRHRADGGTP